MKRTIRKIALLAAVVLAGSAQAQEIKVGGIFDLTGITSDVGKPYAQGVQDGVAQLNASGGINGKKVKLIGVDYGYKIPEAVSAYKRMTGDEKVVMINGWGTGDTLALRDFVNADKIPYFSASFAGDLTDPKRTPYNFFVAPSYSDQLRAWLSWVKADWKDKSRNPKVAFFYGDNAYGKAPVEAGRRFCKESGIDLVDEEILPGNLQDATSQLLNMKQKGADYAYINVTTTGVSIVLKDARKLGLSTKFGSNPYGFSEALPAVAQGGRRGRHRRRPARPVRRERPGHEGDPRVPPEEPPERHARRDVRARLDVRPGLGRGAAARRQEGASITGESVRAAAETLKDFDLGGLTNPVTYTPADHRPSTKTPIYQVKGGKLVKVGEYDMPRRPDWLGL